MSVESEWRKPSASMWTKDHKPPSRQDGLWPYLLIRAYAGDSGVRLPPVGYFWESPDILVVESGGAGRIVLFRGPGFVPQQVRRGSPARFARSVLIPGRALPDLLLITAKGLEDGRNLR